MSAPSISALLKTLAHEASLAGLPTPSPSATATATATATAEDPITQTLKPIADTLRSHDAAPLRHALGTSTAFITATVDLLTLTLTPTPTPTPTPPRPQLHILRLIANLAIDSPHNRDALLNAHAPHTLIAFLSTTLSATTTPDLQLLRTAVGALLNIQLAHQHTRIALREIPHAIPILAHLSYSPAIYPLNAVSALLSPASNAPHPALAIAGFHGGQHDVDGEDALEQLQVRASIASWANQVLIDICSDRQPPPAPDEPDTDDNQNPTLPNGNSTDDRSAQQEEDEHHVHDHGDHDDDDDDNDEPEGEINPDVVASNLPLSALILPLAAFLSSPPSSSSSSSAFPQALARALAADEDARLSLVSTDVELLQNAVQLLEKAVGAVGGEHGEQQQQQQQQEEEHGSGQLDVNADVDVDAGGAIRKKMLERDAMGSAPWSDAPEGPALAKWLDSLASSLSTKTSSKEEGEGEDVSTTPTRTPSLPTSSADHQPSSSCPLAILMHFLERGHAPLLAAAAQRSASSTSSVSVSASSAPIPIPTPSSTESNLDPGTSAGALLRAAATSFARCKTILARVLVELVADDGCMEALFVESAVEGGGGGGSGWFVDMLKGWMKPEKVVGEGVLGAEGAGREDELQSTALLAMGNLARKDSHCIALVKQHDLAPFLVSLLPLPSSSSASTPTPPTAPSRKLAHSVLSLLKNLSIPPSNKATIGRLGLISRVARGGYLDVKGNIQQVQFVAVGLLKHLCRGESGCAVEVVLGSRQQEGQDGEEQAGDEGGVGEGEGEGEALEKLLALVEETEDVPVRMEGTRVLVYIIKALWASPHPTSSPSSTQIPRARTALSSPTSNTAHRVRTALARMLRSAGKYPVLVNEGVVALTLLASEGEGSARGVAEALVAEAGSGDSVGSASGGGVGMEMGASAQGQGQGMMLGEGEGAQEVIMAEPESFVAPPPPSSTSTSTSAAASEPGSVPAAAPVVTAPAPRAGPVSDLLRTETANVSSSSSPHAGNAAGEDGGLLAPGPGPRRQSTAEAYVQAGLAPGPTASSSTNPSRSPLGPGPGPGPAPTEPTPTPTPAVQAPRRSTTPLRPRPSASSILTAPRPSALSMLDVVLGRRDARMPPHFASNAAVLVQLVTSGEAAGAGLKVARGTEDALGRLVGEGPEEALGAAREALAVS
ncbi:unnamed protein product [Tilletia caries]|nr:unnamed protein product [Tilletia caries]